MKKTPKTETGILITISRGGGIVKTDNYPEGIRVYERDLNTGLNGDEVRVRVARKEGKEPVGAIDEILIRAKTEFTGVLVMQDGAYFLKPSDRKIYTSILIPQNYLNDARPGDRVYGTLSHWDDPHTFPEGRIIKRLGRPGDHETEMQAIALERGFEEEFPEEVLKEAEELDAKGITKEDLKDRRDFRNVPTFTIDPFDAKDFDDAISIERKENGDIEVGIHIADVSHYVIPRSSLDREALERGTSVYLVDRTIPMLPKVLSNDLCSLVPKQDRLVMSAVITFSGEGKEKGAWFGPGVIHSAHRFTYEEAQEVIDGKDHFLKEELHLAAHIARGLGKEREKNGALILDTEEVKVLIDEHGVPTKILKKKRTESHTLIEELMLLANRRVAKFLEQGGKEDGKTPHTVIYRVHDAPSEEKTDDLAFFMRSVGHPIALNKDGSIDPKSLKTVLKKLDGNDLKETILAYVIRSMAKAVYSTKNIGHYGLQFEHYAHFTSPIRRYPDLVIHRLLRCTLSGKPAPLKLQKAYERIARLCSLSEMRAADAERESVKFKLTEYMAARIGKELTGIITGIAQWGVYVKDKETTAEGMVSIESLGESFEVNTKLAVMVGMESKRSFRIGDTIQVRVVRANPESRQIDYEIIQG